jgi:hypothetical protein
VDPWARQVLSNFLSLSSSSGKTTDTVLKVQATNPTSYTGSLLYGQVASGTSAGQLLYLQRGAVDVLKVEA